MNIHELSTRTNISVAKLRKLERLRVLTVDPESDAAPALRFHLARNIGLSVPQMLMLIDNPDLIGQLGKYADRARNQIAALGEVHAAPRNVTAAIYDAARGDVTEAETLAGWLRDILPADPVPFYWIAVRLLHGLPATLKTQYAARINIALANVRKLESFAGWSHVETIAGKNAIRYHKPLASMDL